MSGTNAKYSKKLLPNPTKEICADPAKLSDYLAKIQEFINLNVRSFSIVKCPNCVVNATNSGDPETLVQIKNPGFKIGTVHFSHAIFTNRQSGTSMIPPTQTASGFLRNLRLTTDGGAVFNIVIPSSPSGKTVWDCFVLVFEGE